MWIFCGYSVLLNICMEQSTREVLCPWTWHNHRDLAAIGSRNFICVYSFNKRQTRSSIACKLSQYRFSSELYTRTPLTQRFFDMTFTFTWPVTSKMRRNSANIVVTCLKSTRQIRLGLLWTVDLSNSTTKGNEKRVEDHRLGKQIITPHGEINIIFGNSHSTQFITDHLTSEDITLRT